MSRAADIAAAEASLTAAEAVRDNARCALAKALDGYLDVGSQRETRRAHAEARGALLDANVGVEVAMRNLFDCYRAVKAQEVKP